MDFFFFFFFKGVDLLSLPLNKSNIVCDIYIYLYNIVNTLVKEQYIKQIFDMKNQRITKKNNGI